MSREAGKSKENNRHSGASSGEPWIKKIERVIGAITALGPLGVSTPPPLADIISNLSSSPSVVRTVEELKLSPPEYQLVDTRDAYIQQRREQESQIVAQTRIGVLGANYIVLKGDTWGGLLADFMVAIFSKDTLKKGKRLLLLI